MLIRALTHLPGLARGKTDDIDDAVAQTYVDSGYAEDVSRLEDRLPDADFHQTLLGSLRQPLEHPDAPPTGIFPVTTEGDPS